jgi:predicted aspartyl protease
MRGVSIPIEQKEGMMVITAQSPQHSDKSLRLVLDSGTAGLMLFGGVCEKNGFELRKNENLVINVSTNTGNHNTRAGILGRILIGNRTMSDLPALILPAQQRNEDGILPTNLFSRIYFNNSDRFVIFDK